MNNLALDLKNVESVSFGIVPKGKYPMVVEAAEVHRTKNNEGSYLALTFVVINGPSVRKKVFENFNIQNRNDEAVRIGLGRLKNLMEAAGATSFAISDTSQLRGLAVTGEVGIRSEEGFDDRNVIRSFLPLDEKLRPLIREFLNQGSTSQGSQHHAHGQGLNSATPGGQGNPLGIDNIPI